MRSNVQKKKDEIALWEIVSTDREPQTPKRPQSKGRPPQSDGRGKTIQIIGQDDDGYAAPRRQTARPQGSRQSRAVPSQGNRQNNVVRSQDSRRNRAAQAEQIRRRRQARRRRAYFYRTIACAMVVGCTVLVVMMLGMVYENVQQWKEKDDTEVSSFVSTPVSNEIDESKIEKPKISTDLLEVNDYSRPGTKLTEVKNIFVHYTANPGTSAVQNRSYFANLPITKERSASAHYIIGYEGEIIQCIPSDEQAFAVMTRQSRAVPSQGNRQNNVVRSQDSRRNRAAQAEQIRRRRQARRRRAYFYRTIACAMVVGCTVLVVMMLGMVYENVQQWKEKDDTEVSSFVSTPVSNEIDESKIEKPKISTDLLEVNDYSRPGTKLTEVKNIFVHYTANPGTSAVQNRSYFANLPITKERSASAHYIIGYEGEIIQCIPSDEQAFAVMTRNEDSLSIECCYLDKEEGKFTQETYDSLVHMLAWLLQEYDLKSSDILRHYDCGGKLCPLYYVEHEDAWEKLLADVDAYKQEMQVGNP